VSDSEDEADEEEDKVHKPVQDLEVSWGCGSHRICTCICF
jgi:hypothetical protein